MNDRLQGRLRRPLPRRLVLGAAVLAALVLAAALPGPRQGHRPAREAAPTVAIVALARAADAPETPKAAEAPSPPAAPSAPPSTDATAKAGTEAANAAVGPDAKAGTVHSAQITIDEKGVRIEPGSGSSTSKRRHGVTVNADGDFSDVPPAWIGSVAKFTVLVIFVVPLLGVALIVWYKMRRARMLNETLVKLAEKGITPPPETLQALGGTGVVAAAMQSAAPGTPAYDQAKAVRKRAAWSDLRKGVLAAGLGLGLVLYSIIEDQTANGLGLVLLFVGIGYVILWYFEERQAGAGASRGDG